MRWLGFTPAAVLFSADYFPRMYELAERLVTEGKAYVCDLTDEQIREYRGTLSEPGTPSPFRERSVAENLDLLRRMRAGEFPDGARVLRAKIDMASANMKMRDPLLYRIRHAHHHRTGDAWCIYPMYDCAHPLEDAIEGITHSICTLEFENNRELYDWVLDNTGPWDAAPAPVRDGAARPRLHGDEQAQAAHAGRRTATSRGWDDPRMPTIAGMRRRGYSARGDPRVLRHDRRREGELDRSTSASSSTACATTSTAPRRACSACCDRSRSSSTGSDRRAPRARRRAVLPGRHRQARLARRSPISGRVLIDRDDWRDDPPPDYQRLAPGRTVRLRYGYCITADEVIERDAAGEVDQAARDRAPRDRAARAPPTAARSRA